LQFERIVYLSILGAQPDAKNACLASKGRAERLLLDGGIATVILRVPMVLGENDRASLALKRNIGARISVLVRGSSLEQPIYVGDVVAAIVAGLQHRDGNAVIDLAGPESLPRQQLLQRAARVCGRTAPLCVSLPLAPLLRLVDAAEWLAHRLGWDPPVTRAMLEVLDHDDCLDPAPAAAALGVELTALDDTLRRCVATAHDNGVHD
jgi:uncharacterized protein YbjT (DUF2867 family)